MITATEAQMLANAANNQKAKIQEILKDLDKAIRDAALRGFRQVSCRSVCTSTVAEEVCSALLKLGYEAHWKLNSTPPQAVDATEEVYDVTFTASWN